MDGLTITLMADTNQSNEPIVFSMEKNLLIQIIHTSKMQNISHFVQH